jgi:hypothetical protein
MPHAYGLLLCVVVPVLLGEVVVVPVPPPPAVEPEDGVVVLEGVLEVPLWSADVELPLF